MERRWLCRETTCILKFRRIVVESKFEPACGRYGGGVRVGYGGGNGFVHGVFRAGSGLGRSGMLGTHAAPSKLMRGSTTQ